MLLLSQLCGFGSGGVAPADVTPVPINVNDMSGVDVAVSNTVTITGISQPIVLRATCSGAFGAAGGSVWQLKNGMSAGGAAMTNGSYSEVTYANGDTLQFEAEAAGSPGQSRSCTVTITNQSDGGAVLDTFVASITAS